MPANLGRIALYAGGFLGPLGGGVVVVLVPELRAALDTDTTGAAAALTVYLVPFALLQLVSGTIGERLGLERTVRTAYLAYAAVSVAVALASALAPFLVLRALQGSVNAFMTPLLAAALARSAAEGRLGRTMGTFASVQTAGIVLAPLVGGLAGGIDYRLAFLVPAGAALLLACAPLPHSERPAETPRLRAAVTAQVRRLSVFSYLGYLCMLGTSLIVALRAADELGIDSEGRGLLLAGFGVAGVLAGRPVGALVDRYGPRRVIAAGCLAAAVLLPLTGLAGSTAVLAALWALCGFASQALWATIYTLAAGAAPGNQAGGLSIVGASRFAGNATAPLVLVPLYHAGAWLPFAITGAVMLGLALSARRL